VKRYILLALSALAFVLPAKAQTKNCRYIQWTLEGIQRQYGQNNWYIAQQTVTYTVQCFNANTGLLGPAMNPLNGVTATGQGGPDKGGNGSRIFNCRPTFSVAGHNQPYVGTPVDTFTNYGNNFRFSPSGGNSSGTGPCPNNTWCPPGMGYCYFYNTNDNESFCSTIPCNKITCPIIIDVLGTGYQLTDFDDGVTFDMSGTPQKMSWTARNSMNAFLVLPGADGLVHNGSELFGNYTPQPPTASPNGFNALSVYDKPERGGNGDGIIDAHDAIFSRLRLWVDANHDGISQPEELFTLPALGVNSISLHYVQDSKWTSTATSSVIAQR